LFFVDSALAASCRFGVVGGDRILEDANHHQHEVPRLPPEKPPAAIMLLSPAE
jgi:hypothetical protein